MFLAVKEIHVLHCTCSKVIDDMMTNIGKLFVQLFLVISLLIFRCFLPQLYLFSEPEPPLF